MRFVQQLAAVAAVVGLSSVALAAPVVQYNVSVPGLGPYLVGTTPNAGMVVSSDNNTVVALGALLRYNPTILSEQIGGKTVYTVPAGEKDFGDTKGSLALWNYTSSVTGSFATGTLVVDFDPTAGVNLVTLPFSKGAPEQGSQNLDFDYWDGLAGANGPVFDPNALGDYDMTLSVFDASGALLNSVSATYRVEAVPVPAAAMAGFALLGGLGAVRRFRKQA